VRHGRPVEDVAGRVEVAGRLAGNEILFPPDRAPATRAEVDLAIALLAASPICSWISRAPAPAFDWDPPYRHFAPWADWRTIRAVLAHVANGETHYYTRSIGHRSPSPPAEAHGDWRIFLPRSRAETIAFLEILRSSPDRRRVAAVDLGFGEEWWSVRKVLRRLLSHELAPAKSIRRILRAYAARATP
jgi:hypothetical protein